MRVRTEALDSRTKIAALPCAPTRACLPQRSATARARTSKRAPRAQRLTACSTVESSSQASQRQQQHRMPTQPQPARLPSQAKSWSAQQANGTAQSPICPEMLRSTPTAKRGDASAQWCGKQPSFATHAVTGLCRYAERYARDQAARSYAVNEKRAQAIDIARMCRNGWLNFARGLAREASKRPPYRVPYRPNPSSPRLRMSSGIFAVSLKNSRSLENSVPVRC